METRIKPLRILLVDDDAALLEALGTILETEGHLVGQASSAHEALTRMRNETYDLVLADLKMPKLSGLDLLESMRLRNYDARLVIMTAYASVDTTLEAMRKGVYDLLPKPFKLADLRAVLSRLADELAARPDPGEGTKNAKPKVV